MNGKSHRNESAVNGNPLGHLRSRQGRPGRRLGVALLAVTLLQAAACARRPPNVVVIVVDTLRADRLGCYGNARGLTPFLDSLAARGTVFANAYATTSWTCPSVASLMTSRYPVQHHVVSFASKLGDDERTFAEVLQPLGYAAGGFSANFRLLEALGYAQGFQYWRADIKTGGDLRGDALRAQSLEWIERVRGAGAFPPLLLYLHYMEPHAPYEPLEPFRGQFARTEGAIDAGRANELLVGLRWYELTRPDVEMLASLYDAEVANVDAEMRQLFAELEHRGVLDDAIIIVTADHGEEFWEHGNLTHGTALYNESVRIPLILLAPGFAGGRRVEENASLVDVAPTLLELLGVPAEPRFEGRSLVPLLQPRSLRAHLWAWWHRPASPPPPARVLLQLESPGYGLDTREHTEGLVRQAMKLLVRPGGFAEIYDLQRDPLEKTANPPALEAESAALSQALQAARTELAGRAGAVTAPAAIDDATREKLRALGYHF